MGFVTRSSAILFITGLLCLNLIQVGVSRYSSEALVEQQKQITEQQTQIAKLHHDALMARQKYEAGLIGMLGNEYSLLVFPTGVGDQLGMAFMWNADVVLENGIYLPTRNPALWREYLRQKHKQ